MAGFRLSESGRLLVRGKGTFSAAASREQEPAAPKPEVAEPPPDRASQGELFRKLRELRKRIAASRDLPPYVIFSDKTLREMARSRPTDPAAFLGCHGVGTHKLAEYGAAFMEAIQGFGEGQ
jgi:ATP-dependent DNA helicase RecQ